MDGIGTIERGAPREVLVAEDSEVLRRFVMRSLQRFGFEVSGAATIEEVASSLAGRDPDVVLLDWDLGGVSSADLLDVLQARRISTVIMTGDPDSVKGVSAPVLAKPVDIHTLRELLESV